jgi:hypothetical protein
MSTANRLILISLVTLAFSAPAWAGGSGRDAHESQDDPWIAVAVKVHYPRNHPAPVRAAIGVGRAVESFLHWPRILAETLYGDRPLVSRKGILALPETPIEDQIYSNYSNGE